MKPGVGPGPLQLGQRRVLIDNERVSGCNGWNGHPGGEVPMVVATRRRTGRVTACYIAGPQDSVDDPIGIGAFRLFNWFDRRNDPGPNGQVYAELPAALAVISSRRTCEHAGRWHGDHHDSAPIFVLTHEPRLERCLTRPEIEEPARRVTRLRYRVRP